MTRRYLVLMLALAGCPEEQPPACAMVDTSCTGLAYQPTFANVYKNTLHTTTCGDDNGSCHNNAGKAGGLSFEADADTVYAALMSKSSIDPSRNRVTPSDASCSLLTVRTEGIGKDYQMPKGDALPAPVRCSIIQWVANGAMNGSGQ